MFEKLTIEAQPMRIDGMTMTPESPAKTLSQLVAFQIKVEMLRQELKQSELARRIGKNEQWLSMRLRGKQPIDLNDLALIALRGLEVPIHQLLPDPDTASAAAVEPMVRYDPPAERTTTPARRPPDNRPTGQPPAHNVTRTARVPRPDTRTRP